MYFETMCFRPVIFTLTTGRNLSNLKLLDKWVSAQPEKIIHELIGLEKLKINYR